MTIRPLLALPFALLLAGPAAAQDRPAGAAPAVDCVACH